MQTLLHHAQTYAARGWYVFPLHTIANGKCTCGNDNCGAPGKHPRVAHGLKAASTDVEQINEWWGVRWKTANIGIATEQSKLVVIDKDGPRGFASWDEHDKGTPKTLSQRTGRADGGAQLFFYGEGIRNKTALWPGVDVRGIGGYVVAPPSLHASGNLYRWENDLEPIPLPEWLRVVLTDEPKLRRTKPPAPMRAANQSSRYGCRALDDECFMVAHAEDGYRHKQLIKSATKIGALVAGGEVVAQEALDRLADAGLACGLPAREITQTIEDGLAYGAEQPRAAPKGMDVTALIDRWNRDDPPIDSYDDLCEAPRNTAHDDYDVVDGFADCWRERLDCRPGAKGEPGKPKACIGNAVIFLRYHDRFVGKFSWNVRARKALARDLPWCKSETEITDKTAVDCASWFSEVEHYSLPSATWLEAMVSVAMDREFDPVGLWLDSLKWDGHARCESWLSRYLGAEQTRYTGTVGSAWLISAVARVREPGCQVDSMIVIEGEQGSGKSQAVKTLANGWASDTSIDPAEKDSALQLHGPWIVEWSELAGLSRRETEAVKGFLSRRVDRIRPPYGRSHVELQRRCVFVGTTNADDYLSDSTGNRRYWPVRCGTIDLAGLAKDMDQIWAEACVLYASGEPWWLSREDAMDAAKEASLRLGIDPWEKEIGKMLMGQTLHDVVKVASNGERETTMGAIIEDLGIEKAKQTGGDAKRIAGILRRFGWRQCVGDKHIRCWRGKPPV